MTEQSDDEYEIENAIGKILSCTVSASSDSEIQAVRTVLTRLYSKGFSITNVKIPTSEDGDCRITLYNNTIHAFVFANGYTAYGIIGGLKHNEDVLLNFMLTLTGCEHGN